MKLSELIDKEYSSEITDCDIAGISDNTSKLQKGDIFVCIRGNRFDGHIAAAEMLDKGAAAIVADHDLGLRQQIIVPDTRAYFSRLASRYYGEPTKKLKLIGVTGTNGKTTITNLVKFMLRYFGKKCGSIGTIGYDVGDRVLEAHNTTPEPMLLYSVFAEMVKNGLEYCVMEASSQALAQRRISDEVFECSCFTNLTQDHLDYHGTMENYFLAKKMLFDMSKSAVIYTDDAYGKRLATMLNIPVTTYSLTGDADYFADNAKEFSTGVSYWLSHKKSQRTFKLKFRMPGLHNVANSMAAVAMCEQIGFPLEDCVRAIQCCRGVDGRCEVVYDGDFTVICDYAHTEDALEKLLSTMRSTVENRLICVFGAAGERDAGKRKPMGETAARLADYLFVTTDNPRFENPQQTIDDVLEGVKLSKTPYEAYLDREEAIIRALRTAKKGDVVALCGKGHETYQVYGDDYAYFCEREIVENYLRKNDLI